MKRSWVLMVAAFSLLAGAGGGLWLVQRGIVSVPSSQTSTRILPSPPAANPQGTASEVIVTIPPDAVSRMRLKYAEVKEETATAELRVPGTVQPNAYHETRIAPLSGGVVTHVSAELGQTVVRGQAIATIFSRDLAEAQAEFVGSQAELEAEHKKLVREEDLVRVGAASRQQLEGVEASHQMHTAHLEQARQGLLLLGLTDSQVEEVRAGSKVTSEINVSSPADGLVTARTVNVGQVVMSGQDLFTVSDLSSVWVEGNLLEDYFATVQVGSHATISSPAYPGRIYSGVVDYIEPRVDPQTRTAKVRVSVENKDLALRLGMYLDMLFLMAGPRVAVVPPGSVQMIGSTNVVYIPVDGKPGQFRQQVVTPGSESGMGLRTSGGLRIGDRVVTEGSFLLRAEALRQRQ